MRPLDCHDLIPKYHPESRSIQAFWRLKKKTTIESKVVENKNMWFFFRTQPESRFTSASAIIIKKNKTILETIQPKTSQPYLGKLTNNPTHHWLVQLGSGQRDGQGPLTAYGRSKTANPVPQGKPPWGGSLLPKKLQKTTSSNEALPFNNSITTQNSDWFQCQETKTLKTKASMPSLIFDEKATPIRIRNHLIWGLWRVSFGIQKGT